MSSPSPPSNHKRPPPPVPQVGEHHGGSFGVYMSHKIQRLNEQLNERRGKDDVPASRIFEGMRFFVNGWTPLPVEELRALVHDHGGHIAAYETSDVTHMLCTNLPHAKLKQRRAQKLARGAHQQLPVIHPDYVQACVDKGRRLPPGDFLVDGVKHHHGQGIQSFMNQGKARDSDVGSGGGGSSDTKICAVAGGSGGKANNTARATSSTTRIVDINLLDIPAAVQETNETPPRLGTTQLTSSHHLQTATAAAAAASPYRPHLLHDVNNKCLKDKPLSSLAPLLPDGGKTTPTASPLPPQSSSPLKGLLDNKNDTITNAGGGGPLSTKDDPNFLQKYFKSSRLHFIGSFRARMQDLAADHARKCRAARATANTMSSSSSNNNNPCRLIMHVDMDCYFVSALIRDLPHLTHQPVAVAHGEGLDRNNCSSSEISSCNYPARAKGVRAGMFIGEARKLCPGLKMLHYDFGVYEKVSHAMYQVFFEEEAAMVVQPVSCDEAYIELVPGTDPEEAARRVRRRLMEKTRCPASAGVGGNMLLARLATKQAKPSGHKVMLRLEEAMTYLQELPLREIPGVGLELGMKLDQKGLGTCGEMWRVSMPALQSWFGEKTGSMLYRASRGQDDREVIPKVARKSVGAEVNWGVRFEERGEVEVFVGKLAEEVAVRMREARVRGRHLTFKIKRSQYGPKEPEKLLGCGRCDNLSRSVGLARATDAGKEIGMVSLRLLRQLNVPPDLVRGVGIQLTKLVVEGGEEGGEEGGGGRIQTWLMKSGVGCGGRGGDESEKEEKKEKGAVELVVVEENEEEGWEDEDEIGDKEWQGWKKQSAKLPSTGQKAEGGKEGREEVHLSLENYALPPPSQIDVSVLTALPPSMRTALELHLQQREQRQSLHEQHQAEEEGAAWSSLQHWDVTMSQIDDSTLRALPLDMQNEVRAVVRRKCPAATPAATDAVAAAAAADKARSCWFGSPENDIGGNGSSSSSNGGGGSRSKGGTGEKARSVGISQSPPQRQHYQQQQQQQQQQHHHRMMRQRQLKMHAYDHSGAQFKGLPAHDAAFLTNLPMPLRIETLADLERHKRMHITRDMTASSSNGSSGNKSSIIISNSSTSMLPPSPRLPPVVGRKPMEEVVIDVDKEEEKERKPEQSSQSMEYRTRLFVDEDVNDVRRALVEWLRNVRGSAGGSDGRKSLPQTAHLQLLAVYLLERVDEGSEDDVWTLMRSFRRWVTNEGHEAWRLAYRAVLGVLETRVAERERPQEERLQGWSVEGSAVVTGAIKWAGLQL